MASLVSFRAGQGIAVGDAVTVNPSGLLYKASSVSERTARVVGLAINSGNAQDLITVNKDSYFAGSSGLTPGEGVYLSVVSGALNPSYASWYNEVQSGPFSSAYITYLGRAATTSGFGVEISKPFFLNIAGGSILLEDGYLANYLLAEDGSTIDLES